MKCAVFGCTNDYKKTASECSLFTFPTNPNLLRKWMQFCRQDKGYNFKHCFICMEHFVKEDFQNSLEFEMGFAKKRLLKRGAVPSIYKPVKKNPSRSQRIQRRENKKIVAELLKKTSSTSRNEALYEDYQINCTFEDNTIIDPLVSNERIIVERLNTTSTSCEGHTVNIPPALDEDYHENCTLEDKRITDPLTANESHSNDSSVSRRSSLALKFEDFQKEIDELLQENLCLRNENQKLQSELTTLKQNYALQVKKHDKEKEELQKIILKAEDDFKIIFQSKTKRK